ncbi:MAG: polysaccharide biosynthesis protein [Pirellulales bacterium]|nr:polysaccharide biosynthesis protein [Pirellulales bacterium]
MFRDRTLFVTGGTGSFGHDFVSLVLREHQPRQVVVFSRDEKKQHDMRLEFDDPRLSFVIGDVRDRDQLIMAMRGADYVFHAAALKQVPSCEFFPLEAVYTNVIGTNNVLDAAELNGVEKLVVLSTDKAVYPINAMGQTKALMEKLMLARAKTPQTKTVFCGVRYGNVMYSRGSVIPLFVKQIAEEKPLTVTHPDMTRLLLPLADAVTLVTFAMEHGRPGDLFVRKATAATVETLAEAMRRLFQADNPIDVVGVRAGEKMHEVLVSAEELTRAEDCGEYYRVCCHGRRDYDEYFTRGHVSEEMLRDGYTSENAPQLSIGEVENLLLRLPEIRRDLDQRGVKIGPRRAAA